MILDTLIYLAAINAVCAGFDMQTSLLTYPTTHGEQRIEMPEVGPAKYVVGKWPSATDFLIAGASEIIIMTAISYGLKRMGLKRYWLAPQLSVSFTHAFFGGYNYYYYNKWMKYGKERGYY
jgi:hypothetical protein